MKEEDEAAEPIVVATYGTLRAGQHNSYLMEDAVYIAHAKIKGTLYSLGAFPALSLHGNTDVVVELYEIKPDVLRRLDRLEGVDSDFYQRQKAETSKGPAWIYTMDHDERLSSYPIIKSGDWSNT